MSAKMAKDLQSSLFHKVSGKLAKMVRIRIHFRTLK